MSVDQKEEYNPKYEEVLSGDKKGFIQVVHILYESDKASYSDLIKWMYSVHDPTLGHGSLQNPSE